jgi:hypothetical protein
MNSNSKIYNDPCSKKHDDDCESRSKCHRKDEDQEFVLLKVGNIQSTLISNTAVTTIASLPVKVGCLDDPEIKIDFTTNIVPGTTASSFAFTFQVNKTFINSFSPLNTIPVGPSWLYTTDTSATADVISFFVKDTDTFDEGTVRYFVTAVTPSGTTGTSSVTFNNSTLAVTIAAEKE